MKRSLILTLILFCISISNSKSTNLDSIDTQYLIGFHPIRLMAQGMKFDLEQRKLSNNFSYSISPQLYYGEIQQANENVLVDANKDNVNVFGFGVEFSGRYYVSKIFKRDKMDFDFLKHSNFYVFTSLEYLHSSLDYNDKAWVKSLENGVEIFTLEDVMQNSATNKISLGIGMGDNILIGENFFMDFILYSSLNKTFVSRPQNENTAYKDEFFIENGNTFVFVFRFGLLLN